MEFGLIPQIFEYTDKTLFDIQKLYRARRYAPLSQENLITEELKKPKSSNKEKDIKKSVKSRFDFFNTISITNLHFGFNMESEDFFVKAIKEKENDRFSTNDLMSLKSLIMKQSKDRIEKVY